MKTTRLFLTLAVMMGFTVCKSQSINTIVNDATNVVNGTTPLSNEDISNGLKEALKVGTNNSVASSSKVDGFYKNPKIKIPFPKEAESMESTLKNMGMSAQCNKFVETLNRGAEESAKSAAPIFVDAISKLTISDGMKILKGSDNAATQYLQTNTTPQLKVAFLPIVKAALQKVNLTNYWKPLVTAYDKVPMVKKVNPDLDNYVTTKAIEGLFKLIADEELKIRKDPAARINDILKKVFGL